MKKVVMAVLMVLIVAGAFTVWFSMRAGMIQREESAPVPAAAEKSDEELIKDCIMDAYPYDREKIGITVKSEGWAFGTVDIKGDMSSQSYFLAKKEQKGWNCVEVGRSCWRREKILGLGIPADVMKEIEAAGRIPEELDQVESDIFSIARQNCEDEEKVYVNVNWIDSGWALGGVSEENAGGYMFIARKEKGKWSIWQGMQDVLPMSYIKKSGMPKNVADRLIKEGFFFDGEYE